MFKKSYFLIILLSSSLLFQLVCAHNKTTCKEILPPKCTILNQMTTIIYGGAVILKELLCENIFDEETLINLRKTIDSCPKLENSFIHMINIKSGPQHQIIDDSFGIFKLKYNFFAKVNVRFLNSKGFDIDSTIDLYEKNVGLAEFYTDFNLYKKNRLIKSCHDFNQTKSRGFVFRFFRNGKQQFLPSLRIFKPKNSAPICSMFFQHARLNMLELNYMVNSFYLNNLVNFGNPFVNVSDLNSTINQLSVCSSYGVNINSGLLNSLIFSKIKSLHLYCHLNSIDPNIFKSFKIKSIVFDQKSFLRLARQQGIEWIKSINHDIHLNYSKPMNLKQFKQQDAVISITLAEEHFFLDSDENVRFTDKDFCLFTDFPFDQFVFVYIIQNKSHHQFSCTEQWLYQDYPKALNLCNSYGKETCNIQLNKDVGQLGNLTKCQFENRLKKCLNSKNNHKIVSAGFSGYDFMLISDLIILITALLFSVLGMINNFVVIVVVFHRKNTKTMREKHYYYMCLHCLFAAFVCFIHLISLLSECQYPLGLYCSSVREITGIQYLKIVLDYFDNSSRLLLNFTYFGFSMCRLARIGNKHNKFTVFIKDLGMIKYMAVSVLISAGLSVSKIFQYKINFNFPLMAYPLIIHQNMMSVVNNGEFDVGYIVFNFFNCLYDFVNYLVFVLIHLGVDILLIVKLKRITQEREVKLEEMKCTNEIEKIKQENKKSKRRTYLMVLFSSLVNFLTKIPLVLTSFNDLRIILERLIFSKFKFKPIYVFYLYFFNSIGTSYTFEKFCSTQKSCLVFRSFGDCLYLFSLSITLLFLKSFDQNFKLAFKTVFAKSNKNLN